MNILSIQLCSNNRDNHLFRFFLPTLYIMQPLAKFTTIAINYNNEISPDKIKEANRMIQGLGFKLYWQYKDYDNKREILRMRDDCSQLDKGAKYRLLLDDDFEFLPGYERDVLAAIVFMEKNRNVGMVCLADIPEYRITDPMETLIPISPGFPFALRGGIIAKKIRQWRGLYPRKLIGLYGGGEERILFPYYLKRNEQVYYINTSNYMHEQHWKNLSAICGQNVYNWNWNDQKSGTIVHHFRKFSNSNLKYQNCYKACADNNQYWLNNNLRWSYKNITLQELLERRKNNL